MKGFIKNNVYRRFRYMLTFMGTVRFTNRQRVIKTVRFRDRVRIIKNMIKSRNVI